MTGPRRSRPTLLAPASMRLLAEEFPAARGPKNSSLGWILEALEADPDYTHRRMFGFDAAYFGDLLCLVAAAKREPWNGLLVCTSHDRHAALCAEWPSLAPHGILGKWLYLSQDHPEFEFIATAVTRGVLARDPRIGVKPKARKRKTKRDIKRPHRQR